jgi:hypothetical protein
LSKLSFSFSFELNPEDPNYDNYASGADDAGQAVRYYFLQAEKLKTDERSTLQVDFSHMASFLWQDGSFMDNLLQEFGRYEVYLRRAVTQFLNGTGYTVTKNRYF